MQSLMRTHGPTCLREHEANNRTEMVALTQGM